MSTITTLQPVQIPLPFWKRLRKANRFLVWAAVANVFLFLGTVALSIIDARIITGAPAWIKPMKFAISITLYTGTLAWMLTYVEGRRRLVNLIGALTAVGFAVEMIAIIWQAARGVRSHFNISTPFDATLFGLMGAFVLVIWVMNIAAALLLMFQRLPECSFAWSLRLGLIITVVGAGLGYFMVQPTPGQQAAMEAGIVPNVIGAHSIGVEDGGTGLPFTGWSTEGGDGRIPHFVGLHALQILPLTGILINRRWRHRLNERRRTTLVWIAGLGFLGLVLLLLWQAQRGQSIIAPDAQTLLAFGGLVSGVLVAVAAVFVTAHNNG